MTSIYIPNFSFVFCITIFGLYNSDLYSIFSYLYLVFVHFYISHLYSKVSCFYYINALFTFNNFTFVFNLCSLLFYKRLFIFDVLHLYSIVKAQQNLPNGICALLGMMRVFAADWAYSGRRDEDLKGTILCEMGMLR